MNILRDELKKSRNGGYEVIIYLADDQTEFAEELGKGGPDSETKASIINYVKKKYPNLKVTVAKVVLGGVVLGTIPLAGGAAHAAAAGPNDIDKASGFAKDAIVRLVESGTIQGDQTGAFNPKGTMTRDAFTSMIVKALVKDADLVNPDTPTFKDVPKTHWAYKYIETAVAKGLITGTGDGTFSPTGDITREQLATIFVRSLGLTADDIKGQADSLKFADKDAISSFARDSVAFAVNNGLLTGINESTFNGKGAATREQVAVVVDRYVTNVDKLQEAADKVKNTVVAEFASKAVGAKKVQVTFDKAIDTTKATFTIKNPTGGTVTIADTAFADDKKSATLTLASSIVAGEYTVSVGGIQDTALTTKFTGEAEKIADIKFTSDKAVQDRSVANNLAVTTQFKITNQYGEDITKAKQSSLSFTASKGTLTLPSTGVIKLAHASDDFSVGETVVVTALDTDSTKFASATLTVAVPSKVAEVTVDKLYNDDNDTLDVGDTAADYQLVFTAKDQYGMEITDPSYFKQDVIVGVSNPSVVNVAYDNSTPTKLPDVKWDSSLDKLVLALDEPASGKMTAGTSKITVISNSTGKSAAFDITVKDAVKADTISLSTPTLATANASFAVPFSATDLDGNDLTGVDSLNSGFTSITLSDGVTKLGNGIAFAKNLSTGKTELQVKGIPAGTYTLTAITSTNKVATVKFTVEAATKATEIGSVKDLTKTMAVGATNEFDFDNITVLDQYDNAISPSFGSSDGQYQITVVPEAGVEYQTSAGVISPTIVSGGIIKSNTKGTADLVLQLQQKSGTTWNDVGSPFSVAIKSVAQADIKSYEMSDFGTLLDSNEGTHTANHDLAVAVNGVLSDGSKVVVPKTYYTVTTSNDNLTYSDTTNKLTSNITTGYDDNGKQTQTVFVTVKATGDTLEKTVTISNKPSTVTKLELIDGTKANKENDTQVSISLTDFGTLTGADNTAKLASLVGDVVKATDQYGVQVAVSDYKITPSGFDSDTTNIDDLDANSTFYVTAVKGSVKQVFQVAISGS